MTDFKRTWWLIDVHGYGDFPHFGTEDEAEETAFDFEDEDRTMNTIKAIVESGVLE